MSPKIKWLAWGVVIILLVYTRFVNLSWGLPFPFHPDERNIANAVQGLECKWSDVGFQLSECFNPRFFAYGQLPIYLSYLLVNLSRLVTKISGVVRFDEAVMALRFISATASVATAFVMPNLIQHLTGSRKNFGMIMAIMLIVIFSPALIQFAHFGTTESLLMLFFTWLVYLCLRLGANRKSNDIDSIYIWIGVVTGLAIATKVSSLLFAAIPILSIVSLPSSKETESRYESFWQRFNELVFVGFVAGATAIIFSPYNLIAWKDFVSTIRYESMVASGEVLVFYTRSFTNSVPVIFQFQRIFPYALGWPVLISFLAAFIVLPWKRNFNILRIAFLVYFLPTAFLFAKWTRFMAPIFPLMIIISILFFEKFYESLKLKIQKSKIQVKRQNFLLLSCNFAFFVLTFALVWPGFMFLKVYTTEDVRLQASHWMVKNVPTKSLILQETANVVDLPLLPSDFKNTSFNFYELDANHNLQQALLTKIKNTDYIVIPSRRIFKNHERDIYPILNKYYDDLFSGELGFEKVAEFKILDDEDAEETWTVFDHPVVRIYKRM